ncbi:hypothetical protein [Micromonospora sp. CPCC 206061]|uniref:hypothetical protein n=1 Tax=Micromonospora sp. CPCC 206061 TaxID=3122410 RepID=UPI002FF43701
MLVNLTPHAMHIYPVRTPARITPGSTAPVRVIAPCTDYPPARLGETILGFDNYVDTDIPVYRIRFGGDNSSPLPAATAGTWYIVSRPVALAHPYRDDLLVPHGTVRDLDGNVLGSTGFARPMPPEVIP